MIADHENGDHAMAHDAFRDAAQKEAAESSAPVTADRDEIGVC
jgi:hypothetical protein